MSNEPADEDDVEARKNRLRDMLGNVDPEFGALVVRFGRLAMKLKQHGELIRLDAIQGQLTRPDAAPGEAAAFCSGQAALCRESATMQAEMADVYDELAAYFDRRNS